MLKLCSGILLLCLLFAAACKSDSEDPGVDCTASSLSISLDEVVNALCDQSDGSITVSASGGTGNFTYSISGGGENETGVFDDLSAGGYTVTVRDGDCSRTVSATVNNEGGVIISEVSLQDSGCGTSEGMITITAADGIPPYEYALESGAFQSENSFGGLAQGNYLVRVNDSQDCEITQQVHVLSGISWENEVSGIISANCALPDCHGGTQAPDFREFTNVQNNAQNIKQKTSNGEMPPTGALSAELVEKIACWVDDGAPNN